LERSEKFDEYLAAKGVNWLLRKMIGVSSITKIIEKSAEQPGRYNFTNLSSKMNLEYKNWALGEEFENKGFDGENHKITFQLPDDNTLTEHHVRLNNTGDKGDTYYYSIDGDYLILTMNHDAIKCRRFMKRV